MSDPILLWNEVALEANRVSHTNGQGEQAGPTLSSRALAIVHLAMYDAYAGLAANANFPLYVTPPPAAPIALNDETAAAAIAAAAFTSLSDLYPSQRPFFQAIFDGAGASPGTTGPVGKAHEYGIIAANAIRGDRSDDPGAGANYKPPLQHGKHRPDPDNPGQGFYSPEYGSKSRGFGITTRHELAPPPFQKPNGAYTAEYLAALKEVRGLGIRPDLTGALPDGFETRTPDEMVSALFWAYDGSLELGTPPRLYNQIVRRVTIEKKKTVGDNARLFAFLNVAMADAGILAWEQKYIHKFWRPVLGIREHDPSMGPDPVNPPSNPILDEGDADWLPLGGPNTNRTGSKNFTPNFPAYPSGHATFGAAAFQITRLFFGEGGRFGNNTLKKDSLFPNGFVSDELNGISTDNRGTIRPRHNRKFKDGLFEMIFENARSRVLLGVHWIFDAFALKAGKPDLNRTESVDGKKKHIGGVPLGLLIAEDVFAAGGGKAPKRSTTGPLAIAVAAEEGAATFASEFRPSTQR